jgi:hypothetical protein
MVHVPLSLLPLGRDHRGICCHYRQLDDCVPGGTACCSFCCCRVRFVLFWRVRSSSCPARRTVSRRAGRSSDIRSRGRAEEGGR